jgi:hypothetical protein
MNHRTDNKELLEHVLSESTPAEFREVLLAETLRQASRRRYWRRGRHLAAVVAVLGLAGVFTLKHLRPRSTNPPQIVAGKPYQLVRTQALPTDAIITTRTFDPNRVVLTTATAGVIETHLAENGLRIIDDDELLSLVASRPVALVKMNGDVEQLIFVNPEDANGFPLN